MTTFQERLNEALDKKDMKASELARLSGVNEGAISQYRKGKYKASQQTLDRLAAALNVSIPWLMGADVPMSKFQEGTAPAATAPANDRLAIFDDEDLRMLARIEADPNLKAYIKELQKNPKLVTLGRLSAKTTDEGLESILAVTKQIVKTSGCDDIDPEL